MTTSSTSPELLQNTSHRQRPTQIQGAGKRTSPLEDFVVQSMFWSQLFIF